MKMKPDKKSKFINLGESMDGMPIKKKTSKRKKWYPSLTLTGKNMPKGKIGKVGTAIIKYKIKGIQLRDNDKPEICMAIHGIALDGGEENED